MAGKLSDARLRALKATGKVQKIADGGGLYIHVTEKGAKLWRLAYSFDGKQKTLALGSYAAVSLVEARKAREEAKALLAQGLDPSVEKRRLKLEAAAAARQAALTFRAVGIEWADAKKDVWAASNYQKKTRLLEILFAGMGEKNIADIVPADVLSVVRPFDKAGKACTAHVLAQTASQVCSYARACGYCMFNAADGLTQVLRPIESRHYACLTTPDALGRLLRAIDEYSGFPTVKWALKILPYVALRSTELRGAAWAEIDLEDAVWTVPATRAERARDGGGMKMRIAHYVPLARQVLKLFEELKSFRLPGPLCFPGRQSATNCITDNALLVAIRRMGYGKDEMTVHGFRGTFSTLLNEKKLEGVLIRM